MIDYSKRNEETLADFVAYCKTHPEERFWQALRNWSGYPFIVVSASPPDGHGYRRATAFDTFNWEGRTNPAVPIEPRVFPKSPFI